MILKMQKNIFYKEIIIFKITSFWRLKTLIKESLKLAPNRASILINLSKVQILLNKLDEAKLNLDKAIVAEKNPQILINYGLISLKQSDQSSCVETISRCTHNRSKSFRSIVREYFHSLQ
jgi:tetratricopeptide (TPR) repeat protein